MTAIGEGWKINGRIVAPRRFGVNPIGGRSVIKYDRDRLNQRIFRESSQGDFRVRRFNFDLTGRCKQNDARWSRR